MSRFTACKAQVRLQFSQGIAPIRFSTGVPPSTSTVIWTARCIPAMIQPRWNHRFSRRRER